MLANVAPGQRARRWRTRGATRSIGRGLTDVGERSTGSTCASLANSRCDPVNRPRGRRRHPRRRYPTRPADPPYRRTGPPRRRGRRRHPRRRYPTRPADPPYRRTGPPRRRGRRRHPDGHASKPAEPRHSPRPRWPRPPGRPADTDGHASKPAEPRHSPRPRWPRPPGRPADTDGHATTCPAAPNGGNPDARIHATKRRRRPWRARRARRRPTAVIRTRGSTRPSVGDGHGGLDVPGGSTPEPGTGDTGRLHR